MTDKTHCDMAKPGLLKTLPRKLERPMLLLSFAWFLVIVTELVNGMNPLLQSLGTVLWALFVLYFGLRLAIAPTRALFLKRNWLFILAILVPVLRFVPHLQSYPLARALTATFGMQVIWMFASADQGLRSLRRTMGRRGTGYALTFTAFFIGRDAEDPKSEIPNQTSIHQLAGEVALLRQSIEEVLKRVPAAAPRPADAPQVTAEPGTVKPGKVSGKMGRHQV